MNPQQPYATESFDQIGCVESYLAKNKRLIKVLKEPHPYDYATLYRVEFARLPCARHLSDEEYREKIAALVREIEEEAAEKRGDSPVVGMSRIRCQDPHHRPETTKRSPKPRFHAVARDEYLALVAEYREFLANYRAASKALRSGDLGSSMGFPVGCYPPALPFVGAYHEPWTPPPPPTRSLLRDAKGVVVHRGEVPVVEVPGQYLGRSPPSQHRHPDACVA